MVISSSVYSDFATRIVPVLLAMVQRHRVEQSCITSPWRRLESIQLLEQAPVSVVMVPQVLLLGIEHAYSGQAKTTE